MEKLRLIQCGVGGHGNTWLDRYSAASPDWELFALVDPNALVLAAAGEKVNVPAARRFPTLEAALDAGVVADGVLSVTPPAVHVVHARLCHARGLPLLVEKPLSDTAGHAREMAALAAMPGAPPLVVSQNYRYQPAVRELARLVREGVVGELGHGRVEFFIPADFTGTFRETMEYPLLVDMAVHHFDLLRAITGRNVERVHAARGFRPPWNWFGHEPAVMAILELTGGVLFTYVGDWTAHGRATSWNGDWRLQGAGGSLHWERDEVAVSRCAMWGRDVTNETLIPPALPFAREAGTLHAFAEAVRTGEPAETGAADNLQTLLAVFAAVESARTGGPVNVQS